MSKVAKAVAWTLGVALLVTGAIVWSRALSQVAARHGWFQAQEEERR